MPRIGGVFCFLSNNSFKALGVFIKLALEISAKWLTGIEEKEIVNLPLRIEDKAAERVRLEYGDDTLEHISSGGLLSVSGTPLLCPGRDQFYDYNPNFEVSVLIFKPHFLAMAYVEQNLNRLPDMFVGIYPRIWGFDQEDGNEYCFGMRTALKFRVELVDPCE